MNTKEGLLEGAQQGSSSGSGELVASPQGAESAQGGDSPDHRRQQPAKLFLVGIGASAGGLEALRAIFSCFQATRGVAFVVVQHMAPKYRSMLAELL